MTDEEDVLKERIRRLNAQHYANSPARYFGQRLALLLVYASDRGVVDRVNDANFDGMTMGWVEEPADVEDHWRFVSAEALVLMHNVAEALVRMFLAHLSGHWSPWVAIAEQKPFWRFNKDVRAWLEATDDHPMMVRTIFFGGVDGDQVPELAVRATLDMLRDACTVMLDEAAFYNALKHGFAAWVGGKALTFEIDGGEPIEWAQGRALEVIDGGRKKTLWVEPARDMKRADLMLTGIDNLWTVGRARYGVDLGPADLSVPTRTYAEALASTPSAGGAKMDAPLLGPQL